MLKGLALRQGLFVVNGLLVLVLALVLFLAGRELLGRRVNPGEVSTPNLARVASPSMGGPARTREEYDELMKRGFFGDAGKFKRDQQPAAAAAPSPTTETQDTTLPLKLFGTALAQGPRALSAAIIEVREGTAKTGTFYPGDEIISNVILREVRPQEVILDNRRSNTTESLKILWKSDNTIPRVASAGNPRQPAVATAGAGSRVGLVQLDRAQITKKLEDEYARVASTLNVKTVTDDNGKVKGITTDNIENYEVARELGLKNGDVLVSLNNEPVNSKERAIEVLQKYKSASVFRVGLLRSGQMQYLTYRVK